jgi:hypothetical protein
VEESGKVVIRSFRLVFDRGYRRLFKIDRYRLPFAYGLPILGILYAALVALALVLAARLPVAGPALAALPPPIHWVAIPVGLSMVMLHWRPDGLTPHAALWAWLEVLLRYPARGWQRGRRLHVEQTSEQPLYVGTQITLRAGEQLVFEAPER